MIKYLYSFVIAAVLVFIQVSILSVFNITYNLNLLLVFLIFTTIIFGLKRSIIFAVFIGLLINIYSFLPFTTIFIIYLIIIMLINYLYKNVFTNFSYFSSLILAVVGTVGYSLLTAVFAYFFYIINLTNIYIIIDYNYIKNIIAAIILNLILISVFYLFAKTTIKTLNLSLVLKNEL